MKKSATNNPSLFERYELKFFVSAEQIKRISEFASVYCKQDRHSALTPDGYYLVNNLYFDSPQRIFYQMRMQRAPNRFNMRVRSYGENPVPPFFMEIKQKVGGIVRKYRSKAQNTDWFRDLVTGNECNLSDSSQDINARHKALFERMAYTYCAMPKIFTRYRRLAWESQVDAYARLTFDRDLRFSSREDYNVLPGKSQMKAYDHDFLFDPGRNIILELKCEAQHVPLWMLDLIKTFHLERRGFSKYATGTQALFSEQG